MGRIYENANQAIYEKLCDIQAEAIATNVLLRQIGEVLQAQVPAPCGGERTLRNDGRRD